MNSQARVSEFMSPKKSVRSLMARSICKIFAYPQNDAREVANIMKDINIDYMPVLFSPWDRKLVGFIELKKLQAILED